VSVPSPLHVGVMGVTIAAVGVVGIFSGRRVQNSRDFAVSGQRARVGVLVGMLMGIVGGAATVGASQMAFQYGLSGWWFTLGGGIACLAMGLFYAGPLRRSGAETVPEFIGRVYGPGTRVVTGVVATLAMFIQVFGQVLSCVALLGASFGLDPSVAVLLSAGLMLTYVFFGGAWGAGLVGVVKSVLIYISLACAGVVAYRLAGGIKGLGSVFPRYPWFSLFGRGLDEDGAAAVSVVIGLLSTQTYLQVMFAGKDVATCRKAAFASAVLIPPTGLACVLVGMYMKMSRPEIDSAHVLPLFFLEHTWPVIGGLAVASLLVAVVGTGAGLALGMSVMVAKDVYARLLRKNALDREILTVSRAAVAVILASSTFFAATNLKSMILSWAYLSMGIRGSAIFFPLVGAMLSRGRSYPPWVGILGAAAGPAAILMWALFVGKGPDPLYVGLAASAMALGVGTLASIHTSGRSSARLSCGAGKSV